MFEFPVGAGIGFKTQGLLIEARGEFRPAIEQDLMPSLNNEGEEAALHRWGANATIGYEF